MLVVVAVGNMAAYFVQLRRPFEFSLGTDGIFDLGRQQVRQQRGGHRTDACTMGFIDVEFSGQTVYGLGPQVGGILARAMHLANQAVAKTARSRVHAANSQQAEQGARHTQTPGNDGLTILTQARHFGAVGRFGRNETFAQPVQPLGSDDPLGPTARQQRLADGADGARRAIGNIPFCGSVGLYGTLQHCFCRHLGCFESFSAPLPIGKIAR